MSRIGNKAISIPAGVTVSFNDGIITTTGPKGTLNQKIAKSVTPVIEGNELKFVKNNAEQETDAMQGLYRALVANMVKGVSEGFTRSLLINGVGYKAQVNGNKLVMNLGLSHQVEVEIWPDVKVSCPTVTEVKIEGIDKQRVGQFASNIRDKRPVEPYHGYGIRYADEVVIRKVGKTSGKGKK